MAPPWLPAWPTAGWPGSSLSWEKPGKVRLVLMRLVHPGESPAESRLATWCAAPREPQPHLCCAHPKNQVWGRNLAARSPGLMLAFPFPAHLWAGPVTCLCSPRLQGMPAP